MRKSLSRSIAFQVVVLLAVMAIPAFGQDSVSGIGMQGLPGDALSPWDPGLVNRSFVVVRAVNKINAFHYRGNINGREVCSMTAYPCLIHDNAVSVIKERIE